LEAIESQDRLVSLARSRTPAERDRLMLGLADLCRVGGAAASKPPVQALMSTLFLNLVVEAERDMRRRLSQKLATAEWAPPALINILALDEIEIARPVIAASPVLKDDDLIKLLFEATVEHQIEVARRPALGRPVVVEILRQGEPAVLTALAGNPTAELTDADMRELVCEARRVAALRVPLARHPKLTSELALQLYVWLGQAMRKSLTERFRLDAEALDSMLAETVREAHGGLGVADPQPAAANDEGGMRDMERRLVEKLHAAGQLRPGYLVRALREGRVNLFASALSTLAGISVEEVREAMDSPSSERLLYYCEHVGVDRSAFGSVLEMVHDLHGDSESRHARQPLNAPGEVKFVVPQRRR
jgi:uncharacterized protein (DUF2336 family)